MRADRSLLRVLVAFALLAAVGFALPDWAAFLLTLALAKGLVVLGLLVLWRTGLVSFGQALFYGTGGYAVGMLGLYLGVSDIVLLTVVATVLAAAVAALVGLLLARYRDIFFAMLSLAFSMILYGILVKTEALGSTDGFNVIQPTFFGYAPEGATMRLCIYLWTALLVVLAAFGVQRYLTSTMGNLAAAIRDNEIRVEYLGVSVVRVVWVKVIIAGALAGAGGAITAFAVGHVDPDAMTYWTVSGEFVFVTILSGTGNVIAPFVGALLFELIRSFAIQYSPYTWQMVLGTSLLLIILFLPNGLWSLVTRLGKQE
ncbi:MAG TPA: branched-chain amino acid ABC transporter permease [bacterium]|nr:branched-chain amino acid ABC transporter permease [bacterium]